MAFKFLVPCSKPHETLIFVLHNITVTTDPAGVRILICKKKEKKVKDKIPTQRHQGLKQERKIIIRCYKSFKQI